MGRIAGRGSDRVAWAAALEAHGIGLAAAPRPKYGAIPRRIDGFRFDSGREALRYRDLRILEAAGLVTALEVHPRFAIDVVNLSDRAAGLVTHCGTYTADFRYQDVSSGELVIEDVKSPPTRTTAYRLRKRLIEAIHGITIREIA